MFQMRENSGDFCAFCGQTFGSLEPWPRLCPVCQGQTAKNLIPLISVIVPTSTGFLTVQTMPRLNVEGRYLPSTFLDFGETWRQAAARRIGLEIGDLRVLDFEARSSAEGVSHIFALIVEGQEAVALGQPCQNGGELSCPVQSEVVELWRLSQSA